MILDKVLEELIWNFNETEQMEKIRNSAVSKALEKYRNSRENYKDTAKRFNQKYAGSKAVDIHDAKIVSKLKEKMQQNSDEHKKVTNYTHIKNTKENIKDLDSRIRNPNKKRVRAW